LAEVWSLPAPHIIDLAVSPDGDQVVTVDLREKVRCLDGADGSVRWEHVIPDADTVTASRNGALTLAYAARQPLSREVTFIDSRGRRFYVLKPSEPVQFAEVSPGGEYAAVASGKSIIFCSRGSDGVRYRVLRLPGEPQQVRFGPGDSLYVALRNPDRVLMVKSTGHVVWTHAERGASGYSISA